MTRRVCIMDVEDEASAPEGGFIPHSEEMTQGRGPVPKEELAPKEERMRVAKFWRVAGICTLAVFASLLIVHWGAR